MQPSHRKRLSVSKPDFRNRDAADQAASDPDPIQPQTRGRFSEKYSASTPPLAQGILGAIPVALAVSAVRINVIADADRPFELADLFTRDWAARNSSFLISFAFHTFVILMFSLVLIHSTGKALIVLELMSSPDIEEYDALVADIDIDFSQSDELVATFDDEPFNSAFGNSDGDQQVVDQGMLAGTEGGGQRQANQGDGKSAKFFGTKAGGNSFVYVLDRSGSMAYESSQVKDFKVSRFDVARLELLNSVESLQPHQEFYVVLFSTGMRQMFNDKSLLPKPVKATPENKQRLRDWLSQNDAVGGTDPRESLKLAYKMKPDAIFMLSDGEFLDERTDGNPLSIDIARQQAEQSSIRINSIALEDANSKKNMEELSGVSGGQFRFVKVKDYVKDLVSDPDGVFRLRVPNAPANGLHVWDKRLEFANRTIDALSQAQPECVAAEARLHELTFGLFVDSIPSVAGDVDPIVVSKAVKAWKDVWRNANDQSDLDLTKPTGLFATLSAVDKKNFLETVESLNVEALDPLHQIALARSILDYQKSSGVISERTRGLLLQPLEELNKESTALFGKDNFLNNANQTTCENRLEKILRNRRSFARKLMAKSKNKRILESVRLEHAKDLIALYPETDIARKIAEQFSLPISHVDNSD